MRAQQSKNAMNAKGGTYEIDEAEVIYWGRCSKCLAQTPVRSGADDESVPVLRVTHSSDDSDTNRATGHNQTDEP